MTVAIAKSSLQPRTRATSLRGAEDDRYLRPGTLVRLAITVNERHLIEPEVGVVLHCWRNPGRGKFDCMVAFVGEEFRAEGPIEEPYITSFAASSLAEIGPDELRCTA